MIIQGRDDHSLVMAWEEKMKRRRMDVNDVHKITRFDGKLGMKSEEDKGPRMTCNFQNHTVVWMALILTEIAKISEEVRFGERKGN